MTYFGGTASAASRGALTAADWTTFNGKGSGSVTSVGGTGTVNGITLTGTVTTSGNLTLGGALSGVSLTSQITGTLPVANGGTGQTSYTNGQLLIGKTTGNTLSKATLTSGSGVSIVNGAGSITISATGSGGTVTSVSVVSANGFAGTVATATATPAITLSTSISGVLKGNGTAISAASAGTDYVAPSAYTASGLTMATSRLLGRTTGSAGAAEEISIAGGLTLSGGVLTGLSGTVTSVGSTGTVNGITLTGTVTTSGSLTLGGTLSGVSLTSQVTGTLPVANGGTGQTSYTSGQLLIGNTTGNTLAKATLTAGTNISITNGTGAITINSTDQFAGTVTSVGSTGTVNGITLTGTVTSSGSLTLGGTLSGVNLTSQVTGTLPVANGGTGATTLTGYVKGAGTSVFTAAASVPAADVSGLATVATSGSFADLSNHPGVQSNGQAVLGGSHVISTSTIGTNILIVTSGITLTFPATGFASGEGVAVSNVSGGNVTLAIPGGADFGTTLPTNGTFLAFCDGGGFWRQYCYSTTRL